ncbi:hypothetical protein XENTR_v10013470 [Xenopus tropicalis]|nr:hypothetical protein XENTR_v10013470 [Xenopus tropicalis]
MDLYYVSLKTYKHQCHVSISFTTYSMLCCLEHFTLFHQPFIPIFLPSSTLLLSLFILLFIVMTKSITSALFGEYSLL